MVIAPNRTEVVVYENPAGDDGLPFVVPVVVSYGEKAPSVAFRIACGSNYGRMLEGFGYPRDLDLDSVDHYGSLETLQAALRARSPNDAEVPLRTLRCDVDESVTRSQVVGLYRVIDADASKGQANYYARFKDEPGAVYTVGCWNLVKALGWDDGVSPPASLAASFDGPRRVAPGCSWACDWQDSSTTAINAAVLGTWAGQGIQQRELNCYDGTAVAIPPPQRTLPITIPVPTSGRAELYRVRYAFDGINAPMPLYLISEGKGYAIDCGSNQLGVKAAFGFDPDYAVPEVSATDPAFLASGPGQQPHLRCANPGATVFETLDETPKTTYFRFAGAKQLFHFTSDVTRDFFLEGIADVRRVPRASIPYLIPDENQPNEMTPVLHVGWHSSDECGSRTATCAAGTRCVDDTVGYHCEACPPGYTSDGYTCLDVDECAARSATCATPTYCVNQTGSYRCASCKIGEASDGYTCRQGPPFVWFDTLEADRKALGFSTYGGKKGYDWLRAAGGVTAARMATLFCAKKGYPGGRINGWAAGEKIGVRCNPAGSKRYNPTREERKAYGTLDDVSKAPWWQLHAVGDNYCRAKGEGPGTFTGESDSAGRAAVHCLPKLRTQWFDTTRAERKAVGFDFESTYTADFNTAALMATVFCERKGYVGGFVTGWSRRDARTGEDYSGVQCYK